MDLDALPSVEALLLPSPAPPEPLAAAPQVAQPPKPKRRVNPRETVWQTLRNRPKARIASAGRAVEIWRNVKREGLGLRSKLKAKCDSPDNLVKRSMRVGEPVGLQVAALLEEQPAFAEWEAGTIDEAEFLERIGSLFPRTFLKPWPGLCDAERDEMARDLEEERKAEERRASDGGRLRPGMRHIEP